MCPDQAHDVRAVSHQRHVGGGGRGARQLHRRLPFPAHHRPDPHPEPISRFRPLRSADPLAPVPVARSRARSFPRTGRIPASSAWADAQPQGLDQLVVGAQCGRDLRVFRLQCRDQRLQKRRIIGKDLGHGRHASSYHKTAGMAIKTRCFSEINQPTRAGGAPQSGLRQSIPSQSIANCAEVRRAAPSPCAGQGKRPFSSTL